MGQILYHIFYTLIDYKEVLVYERSNTNKTIKGKSKKNIKDSEKKKLFLRILRNCQQTTRSCINLNYSSLLFNLEVTVISKVNLSYSFTEYLWLDRYWTGS